MLLCGVVFPLVITGFAQVLLSDQANGSLAHLNGNGRIVGSYVVAQNFSLPFFFHPRNVTLSASGVDPDIPLAPDALSQIPRISAATNITQSDLSNLVSQNIERTSFVFGDEYVNVLRLNLALIQNHQSTFQKLAQQYSCCK